MRLAELVDAVTRVHATNKKSEKVRILADTLFLARARGIGPTALSYRIAPPSQSRSRLESHSTGGGRRILGGTFGITEVDDAINRLAGEQGAGSTERRATEIGRLFSRATVDERCFLSQLLIGEIRQGALEGLLLEAIARATHLPPSDVRHASLFVPSVGVLARAALEEGAIGIGRFSLGLFTPVAPMSANSAEDVGEALNRLEEAAWEYKLDGARIQVHKGDDEVRIFTRQLQNVTQRLPEIVE